jgi:hypothetical protein
MSVPDERARSGGTEKLPNSMFEGSQYSCWRALLSCCARTMLVNAKAAAARMDCAEPALSAARFHALARTLLTNYRKNQHARTGA